MDAGPRIDSYTWSGGREPMLRFGPADGSVMILALPLFEEANRTRAFGVSILRALAVRDIGGVLPDLPGQGESARPTAALRLADLRAALAAVPGSHVATIRSASLIANATRPCWSLSPQTGPELVRELSRVTGSSVTEEMDLIAGNIVSRTFLAEVAPLSTRQGEHDRVVRLGDSPHRADIHVQGAPPWRRAEPENNLPLAQRLADDIEHWLRTCAA